MPNYGDPQYWEERYREQEGTTFDWLEDYGTLKSFIDPILPNKDIHILILGCGNAEFSEDMYEDGYHNIHNIDISTVVIEQMIGRNTHRPQMIWVVMDVRDIKYPDNFFDLVVDKSTIDALLCGEQSFLNVARMTKEVQRVLKVDGYYMVISYGTPENRVDHFQFEHLNWDLTYNPIGGEEDNDSIHYCYICKKKEGWEEVSRDNWDKVERKLLEEDEEGH